MKPLSLFLLVFSGVFSCYGQLPFPDSSVSRVRIISVSMGLMHTRLIDEGFTMSRLLFRGNSFKLKMDYSASRPDHAFSVVLEGSSGVVKTRSGDLPSQVFTTNVIVSHLMHAKNYRLLQNDNTLFAGLEISSLNQFTIDADVLGNGSLLAIHGVYGSILQEMDIGHGKRLRAGLVIPIAGFVKRAVADGAGQEPIPRTVTVTGLLFDELKFTVPPILQLQAEYLTRISPWTDFYLRYRFAFTRDNSLHGFNAYSNEMLLGLRFLKNKNGK